MPSFFEQPILNSPYAYPGRHWELDADGRYTRAAPGSEPAVTAQSELLETYAAGAPNGED